MSIWFKETALEDVNALRKNTLLEHLDIQFVEIGENELRATMPVDHRTVQPLGLLHGGASAALAESLGSVAATLCVNTDKYYCVGLEINANHIRSVRQGTVTGVARPIHIGKTTQVWEIRIYDQRDRLVCISRITLAVMNR